MVYLKPFVSLKKFKDLQKERETQKLDKIPVRKRRKNRHRNGTVVLYFIHVKASDIKPVDIYK